MKLLEVLKVLDSRKIPYALVGGHAVALHGAVRGTVDIDFIINWSLKNLEKFEEAMTDLGLSPRHPISANDVYNFKDEYIKNKNLIAWNFIHSDNPLFQIDLVITTDLKNKSVKKIKVGSRDVRVLSKKDLIEMKKKSGREQDLSDVEALESL
jgi:hypothetical protein